MNLAELEFNEGRFAEALGLGVKALEIWQRGKNAKNITIFRSNITLYRIALKDLDGARSDAHIALRGVRQIIDALMIAGVLQHLALLGALRGEFRGAAHLIGYINARYVELGYEREDTVQWNYENLMTALREHLCEAEIDKLAAEGAAWSENQAVEEALRV